MKDKPVVYLKGSKLKRIKNSKAGRKFIIAATAFVALAVPATANASVNLHVVGSPMFTRDEPTLSTGTTYVSTTIDVAGDNGWRPSNCQSTGILDDYGNPFYLLHQFNVNNYGELVWSADSNGNPRPMPNIEHAGFQCDVTKTITKVTHKLVWKTFTQHRSGVNTTSRSHSGSCYINNLSPELHLDCWGGNYAQANYHFALPSDARNISRNISTRAACCNYSGYTSKSWSGNTAIVRATGWHGVYIRGVTISYQHRVSVRVVTKTHLHNVGIGEF